MSFRYGSGINKPGFDPLAAQTSTTIYDLYTWGRNSSGELGLNNLINKSSPTQVGASTDGWTFITMGLQFSLAIKSNKTLWSWGRNDLGQLAQGDTTQRSSPVQVGSLSNWSTVSGGGFHALATKTDGTLWSWGYNLTGQLGLGNTTYYSSPKQVGALTSWLQVSAGYTFSAAIKTDGTLWTWGRGATWGVLGLGNTTNYSSPKQVGALTNWSKVASGVYVMLAVKTDGTLWAWGNNNPSGQLGLGNKTNYSSPKQVGALTTWLSVSCGFYNTVAIKTDGTLWTWGGNGRGELGLGNTTYYSSPKQVGALTTWSKISTMQYAVSVFVVKTDGTLWSWGGGANGALGLGNTTNYSSPKQVGALTSWLSAAASLYSAAALN